MLQASTPAAVKEAEEAALELKQALVAVTAAAKAGLQELEARVQEVEKNATEALAAFQIELHRTPVVTQRSTLSSWIM